MTELNFTKATDQEHEVKPGSYLISASWRSGMAYIGAKAPFEVRTALVGNGAKVKVKGKSEKGKKLGKAKGELLNNVFVGELDIPEKTELDDLVYFEVEISGVGLSGESARVPVFPMPKIKSIKWSAEEARRGDILTLSAELEDINDGTEVTLVIYEYDSDGAYDRITELPATVKDKKIEEQWEYEYYEDTDELPTSEEVERYGGSYNPPEYFFTIKAGDFELGKADQDSGLLKFKDWLEIRMFDNDGAPVPNVGYKVTLPDGEERNGSLDDDGYAREERIPPGRCLVEFEEEESEDGGTGTAATSAEASSQESTGAAATSDDTGKKKVMLHLRDNSGKPLSNKKYKLRYGSNVLDGSTNSEGQLTESIPSNITSAELEIADRKRTLKLDTLQPLTTYAGVQARLNNLGFFAGPVDNINGPKTKAGVRTFQAYRKILVDGIVGPQTRKHLKDAYGC